jgi:RNA-directed DNA polymerase
MSSETTVNPNGGVGNRRVMEDRSLNPVTMEDVVQKDNILRAWKQVRANKGAPGVDGISIEEFPLYAHDNWKGIKQSLLEGSYHPAPVKRVEIPKDNGGTRPLGIPVVTDRLIFNRRSVRFSPPSLTLISLNPASGSGRIVPPTRR